MKAIYSIILLFFLGTFVYAQQDLYEITLTDIWAKYTFYPKTISGINSMNDGENYTVLEQGQNIVKYRYKDGEKVSELFNLNEIKPEGVNSISEYELSADESKILITTNEESIYRHSFTADYYIYDIKNKKITQLSKDGKQQLASFSPDGSKVAFMRDNNMFVYDLNTGKESAITNDGVINEIINGAPDWVYEEEFSFSKAYDWSPDSKKIAFMKFDESKVKQFNLTMYGSLYPEEYKYKYPKAGEENSIVSVLVYDITSGKTVKMDVGQETDQYIPRIKWTKNASTLSIYRMNRLQNKLEMLFADATTGNSTVIYKEENKKYIEITDDLTFLDDGSSFIISNETSGFRHLYLYDINGNLKNKITSGMWDVTKYIGYDPKTSQVYFQSAEVSPYQRYVYSVKLNGSDKKQLTERNGVNDVVFSKTYKYYICYNSDANTPEYVSLHDSKGKMIRELETNKELFDKMKKFTFSRIDFFSMVSSSLDELKGWMMKPIDFNPTKKYPVLLYIYGGPGHQTVMDEWDYSALWFHYLAQNGVMVISVDNRGTDGRGESFKKCTYGQLGNLETQDQIDVAKYLATLPFVDPERIGIMGWSYGGYMSTLCITKGADWFKLAVAVAPVTNWRFYDSIYTERYMGLPKDNADGYDDNSPINHVQKLRGKYLLIHGTADDNVHLQNTMELVDALQKANKQFDLMLYPNKNHGIYGGTTRLNLYTKMSEYILKNL